MTAESFQLYDFLDLCATAIDESESERPAQAETAWLEACIAESGLFSPGSQLAAAAAALIDASRPSPLRRPGHYTLWNALNAAAVAVLPAMEGDRETARLLLDGALAAASMLPRADWRDALGLLLTVVRTMANAGNEVSA